jgi:hypothetical protein
MRARTATAHGLFHLHDGFTERWLFDSALLRGAREAQFVTNREKISDVLCFHGITRDEAPFRWREERYLFPVRTIRLERAGRGSAPTGTAAGQAHRISLSEQMHPYRRRMPWKRGAKALQ